MLDRLRGKMGTRLDSQGGVGTDVSVFFVTGHPKSGTGWLMKLLDAHPEVMCRGEGRFFGRDQRIETLKDHSPGTPGGRMVQPSSLHNALSGSEYLRMWIERSVWTKAEPPDEHLAELTGMAVRHFMIKKLEKANRDRGIRKRMVGDKTPLVSTDTLREIGEILPGSKVIHILRDGRDQAVSIQHHIWRGGSGWLRQFVAKRNRKKRRLLPGPRGVPRFERRYLRAGALGRIHRWVEAQRRGRT